MNYDKFIEPKQINIGERKFTISKIPALKAQVIYTAVAKSVSENGALGMTMLQQMRQLIAVAGIHRHFQRPGGFPRILGRPAFGVGSRGLGCCSFDLISDQCAGAFYRFLHIVTGHIGILVQFLHDGFGERVNGNLLICHIIVSLSGSAA